MNREDARHLLEQAGFLRRRCDVDLLVFFARHPRTMLTSKWLAACLGYEPAEIAKALDNLLAARLVKRQQTPAHAARQYVFAEEEDPPEWLPRLLQLATTREGRLALRELLAGGLAPEKGADAQQ